MIKELLKTGEVNAISAAELAKITGLEVRAVMHGIRHERMLGAPICSSSKGYFLPADKYELQATINRLYNQAGETKRVAEAMEALTKTIRF